MAKKKRSNKHRNSTFSRRKPKAAKKRKAHAHRYDTRLEFGLQYFRKGDTLAEAARKIGISPARLRSYATATGIVSRKDGKWTFKRDRRFRRMPLYSDGRRAVVTVHNGKTASLIGSYMRAVRGFFDTENIGLLDPFRDQSVPDVNGKRHFFETRPNVLLRLDASGVEPFEITYEIIKRE